MRIIKVISYSITLGIMALIFFFSSQSRSESSALSSGLIQSFLNFIPVFSFMTEADKIEVAEELSFIVRKTAHFVIYASLGASSLWSARLLFGKCYKTTAVYAFSFCVLYAISDEVHQMFVMGRGPQLRDVCIDSVGAATGIAIIVIIIRITKVIRGLRYSKPTEGSR